MTSVKKPWIFSTSQNLRSWRTFFKQVLSKLSCSCKPRGPNHREFFPTQNFPEFTFGSGIFPIYVRNLLLGREYSRWFRPLDANYFFQKVQLNFTNHLTIKITCIPTSQHCNQPRTFFLAKTENKLFSNNNQKISSQEFSPLAMQKNINVKNNFSV